jgi:hypothetical protein
VSSDHDRLAFLQLTSGLRERTSFVLYGWRKADREPGGAYAVGRESPGLALADLMSNPAIYREDRESGYLAEDVIVFEGKVHVHLVPLATPVERAPRRPPNLGLATSRSFTQRLRP